MRCRYCGGPIAKRLIGWFHISWTATWHVAKPRIGRAEG